VEHLAKICWSVGWKDGRFAVFTVALDASTSSDSPVLCVAGFVSSTAEWMDFETSWNRRLAIDGIDYWHTHEWVSSRGQFHGWDRDKKRTIGGKLIEDLMDIIRTHAFRKFGCIIFIEFLEKIDETNRERFIMDKAYAVAGRHTAHDVAVWARMERFQRLPELVFECGDFGKGDLIDGLVKQEGWPMPQFRPATDMLSKDGLIVAGFVPLQAADLLAHTYFSHGREMEASEDWRFDEKWRYRQFEEMQGTIGYYSPENIDEMNQNMKVLREQEDWAKSKGLKWH
jgi:hypothetical protein